MLCDHDAVRVGAFYGNSVRLFNDGSFAVAGSGAVFVDGESIVEGGRDKVVNFDREAGVEVDVGDVVVVL